MVRCQYGYHEVHEFSLPIPTTKGGNRNVYGSKRPGVYDGLNFHKKDLIQRMGQENENIDICMISEKCRHRDLHEYGVMFALIFYKLISRQSETGLGMGMFKPVYYE